MQKRTKIIIVIIVSVLIIGLLVYFINKKKKESAVSKESTAPKKDKKGLDEIKGKVGVPIKKATPIKINIKPEALKS
jgi:regulatory protein YycI of two-component signal transduction system YycFG